jgi:hypothetical protein
MNATKFYPFWSDDKYAISTSKLTRYLASIGFGRFQTTSGHAATGTVFRNVSNILQVHDASSVKRVLTDCITSDPNLNDEVKDAVQDKIIRITPATMSTYLSHLPAWSVDGFDGTHKLNLFMDNESSCCLPFRNGVVVITADSIELKPYEVLENECIWESSRLNHEITLYENNQPPPGTSEVFKNFIHFALKTDQNPCKSDLVENYDAGTSSKKYLDSKRALETAYGYLIHNHNPVDEMKMVVFADLESSSTRAEGRNGKSLTMKTLEYYKRTAFVDGKLFRKSINDSARFNFSSVSIDSRLVIINDLNPDIDLTQLFSQISDDFTIEGKGTNKIVIPYDKKPKLCCNTNYVLSGSGASYDGRQHIIEFGNYFNKCEHMKLKPKDILGKKIGGKDFTAEDWNAFYSYGFYCVQKYLREGLFKAENSSYQKKNLIRTVEGENGTGELVDWLENWCQTTRISNNYHVDGISENDLYNAFLADNPELSTNWNFTAFHKAVYVFATSAAGYDYNPHNACKGNSKSLRKWRKGAKGAQMQFVKIVHLND